jgi:hypothetical protein
VVDLAAEMDAAERGWLGDGVFTVAEMYGQDTVYVVD